MGPGALRVLAAPGELTGILAREAARACRTHLSLEVEIQAAAEIPPGEDALHPLLSLLSEGRADLVVAAAESLPPELPEPVILAALLPTPDPRDAVLRRPGLPHDAAPERIAAHRDLPLPALETIAPGGRALSAGEELRDQIAALDGGALDALIAPAASLRRLGLEARITGYLDADPAPHQGRIALLARMEDRDLVRALRGIDVRRLAGLVAIVGCPADPALMNERTRSYLASADVILHDRLISDHLLRPYADRAESVGKKSGGPSVPQPEIHRRILLHAEQGRLVVRLHGGDPGIYGHLAEELGFLHAWGLRTDLVPAVSAAQVAAAGALAPLTDRDRGRRITFVSGHASEEPIPDPHGGHLAVYMGVARRAAWSALLMEAGWPAATPIVLGERVGGPEERIRISTLAEIGGLDVESPAVVLAGPRAFGPLPHTLFVGSDPEAFLAFGPLLHWPMIELRPIPLEERADTIDRLLAEGFDGVLFPSRLAAKLFIEALLVRHDARALAGLCLAAVGATTARELRRYGLRADVAAETSGGVREIAKQGIGRLRGRVLYPCSDAAPVDDRRAMLAPLGIELDPRVFYRNERMPYRPLPRARFDRVLFTSARMVETYFEAYPGERSAARDWLAAGPSTRKAIEALGLEADVAQRGSRAE